MPRVSVIVPVHNAEKYLGECLDSIHRQTLKDIEVICVDDGSTDSSPDMLARRVESDPRFRVIRQDAAGAGTARNRGMREAAGEYLYFCDADDWIDSCMLSKLYERARRTSADIVVSGVRYFDETAGGDYRCVTIARGIQGLPQPFAPASLGERLFSACRTQAWNKLFRREFVAGRKLAFQELPRVNDLAFVNTALACAERIAVDGGAYYHYRKNHGGNLSAKINEMPEMSALAWLHVRDELKRLGRFDAVKPAFCISASQAVVNAFFAITDPVRAEEFFREVRQDIMPRFGFGVDDVSEDAKAFFADGGPLGAFMSRLAKEREISRAARAKYIEETRRRSCPIRRIATAVKKLFRGGRA